VNYLMHGGTTDEEISDADHEEWDRHRSRPE